MALIEIENAYPNTHPNMTRTEHVLVPSEEPEQNRGRLYIAPSCSGLRVDLEEKERLES